jgi:antitoxin VapB
MSLNIKNPETTKLIRELADATGESLTEAVTTAVRERLQRVRTDFDVDEVLEWVGKVTEDLPPDFFDIDHDELLYDDELGLPK